jgi:hypothetical protein
VHSASPPEATTTTVPVEYSLSVVYFSAKSAYRAAFAVPENTFAVRLPEESR